MPFVVVLSSCSHPLKYQIGVLWTATARSSWTAGVRRRAFDRRACLRR